VRPTEDVRELWRRLLFNTLITNVDDHLWNLGVLYAGGGLWRLAPAFDLNPFPDRDDAAAMARQLVHWRAVATSKEVGMKATELEDFAPTFEHQEIRAALDTPGKPRSIKRKPARRR
jgi:serine/threonine-protein kinase HipA